MELAPLNVAFGSGLRFEIFYSLQLLCDSSVHIHSRWRSQALARCPGDMLERMRQHQLSPLLWVALADAPGTLSVEAPYEVLADTLESLPLAQFQRRTLSHFFHEPDQVDALCKREASLADAARLAAKTEAEWLAYAGLFPFSETASLTQALEALIQDPEAMRRPSLRILHEYWEAAFESTWAELAPRLRAKQEEKQRLYETSDFETFARMALIPVEMDHQTLRAVRSGHEHELATIDSVTFCPSAFNYRRLRAVIQASTGLVSLYFPFFLPELGLTQDPGAALPTSSSPYSLDAALIFRALGDTTRYAIASIIAREPTSSARLARKLSLSRATVSHHVRILREAGLLVETHAAGSVLLALQRRVIEQISRLAERQLYG
jgi:DNA-binding transcriptional ArsR family regulator